MARLGGVGTLSVTAAIAVAGLVLLQAGGAVSGSPYGPSSTAAEHPAPTTEPAPTTDPDSEPTAPSTAPSTAVTSEPSGPAVPAAMSTRLVTVGVGGFVRLSGTCPTIDGEVVGPVEIWQVGGEVVRIATGIAAEAWTYDWQAPPTPDPIVLQVWCGDPSESAVGFPSDQEIVVVFVAQQQATTAPSTTVAAGAGSGGAATIDPLPGTA